MSLMKLTVADIAEVEELSNQPWGVLADSTVPKGRLYQAIAFVLKRKEVPDFTFEQAGLLTMADINELMEGKASTSTG
jgi:hypothetical protein